MVFVLFAAEFGQNTHRLRQFVSDMSHQGNFKDAHFLYVDVERVPEVLEEYGITSEEVPVFACFRNGQLLDKYPADQKIEGVLASAMFTMFSTHSEIREAETTEQRKEGFKLALQIIGGLITLGALALGAGVMLNNPTTSSAEAQKILWARKLSNQGGRRLRGSNINDDEEQGDDYDASDDDYDFDDDF